MKNKLTTAIRHAVFVVILLLYVFGLVCHEKTLTDWWHPVVMPTAITLLTAPAYHKHWK